MLRLQKSRHPHESENPACRISVFSGVSGTYKSSFPRRRESRTRDGGNIQRLSENSEVLDSRLRGNDGGAVSAFPINDRNLKPILPTKTEKQKPKIPSFSRKQLLRLPSKMPSERSSLQTAFFISHPYR
ncbi:hypothetical protein FOG08_08730 [Neisseria meningitidis]|nr:hypothetical protein NMY233_1482 [Neisseria meningitidis NM233]MBG8806772.1 hypothetical protein [Neisseria meningitidis]MBG8809548.1 hypothetical protein [Neisseria meningitidis]MBG8841824.1 hypothetical protein [Neisseria meningitidis]QEM95443.1 hypothetical protein CCD87_06970 [Neisseria meningitidis]